MFTDFLYLLRSYGMKTSLMSGSLMDALEMNLKRREPDGVLLYGEGGSGQKRVRI